MLLVSSLQQAVMLAENVAGAKQVMSELIAARPWYGRSDAEWAQWIAGAPAENAPIRRQIHQLSQDNMA